MLSPRLIYQASRRQGSTEWLLKAAMNNPNVIIVAPTEEYANNLRKRYTRMIYVAPWYKRTWWFFFGKVMPSFISVEGTHHAIFRAPIVFDNSALDECY